MTFINVALGSVSFMLIAFLVQYFSLWNKYKKLERRVTWVESSSEQIENLMALQSDLQRFGKATMEIRRLDQSGIFYREPA